jgi:hypothetical protein
MNGFNLPRSHSENDLSVIRRTTDRLAANFRYRFENTKIQKGAVEKLRGSTIVTKQSHEQPEDRPRSNPYPGYREASPHVKKPQSPRVPWHMSIIGG